MKSSLYRHVTVGILNMSLHLQNCFQLLQMLQVQWMVMDDKDNGYLMKMMMMPFVTWLKPIGITAAENKSTAFQTTPIQRE